MANKLLLIGLLAITPIFIVLEIGENLFHETLIQDSDPLKFILMIFGWLGLGLLGASLGSYSTPLVKKLGESQFTDSIKNSMPTFFS